ncbi:MAG: hypothetical protein DRG09_07000 [Epsilonproteobacteria bacterium]|nr:MAG: hypothetical protein DRG09_07000 [Campylobacterota bacterium]
MYDIRPLEEEWKKYRKKKQRPWYLGIIIFLVLLFLIFFFSSSSKINFNSLSAYFYTLKSSVSFKEVKSENVQHTKSNIVVNGPLMRIEVDKQVIDKSESVEDAPANILVDIPILDGKDEGRSSRSGKARKKIHLDIIKTTNITAYKDVENRFKRSHDTDDSLFLARSYYKKGNYKKSEYWALETNKVNPNIEESMLIFVKSKMKLGRKNEARNILTAYMKKSNSHEAKKLLYSIENGKF